MEKFISIMSFGGGAYNSLRQSIYSIFGGINA